jgi:hypothetical protein
MEEKINTSVLSQKSKSDENMCCEPQLACAAGVPDDRKTPVTSCQSKFSVAQLVNDGHNQFALAP